MTDPLDTPFMTPTMVGRESHLAALRRRLDEAIGGAGQVVLVAGEAGIGKTRLVGEVIAYARTRGVLVQLGQCFEPDRALPYAPFRDLIAAAVRRHDWPAETLAAVAPDLAEFVPALAGVAPGPSTWTAEQTPRRVAHAVGRLVEETAARTPLLLVVEDAHWSDDASLDLLMFLARRLRGADRLPTMLIVTYRADEPSPGLAAALATLDRERLAAEARVGPLPRAEVLAMLRGMSDRRGTVGPELAETIFRLSEGNPFFVEELLRSASADDTARSGGATAIPLPRSVAEAVERRVRRLSDGARETLTIAAVAGRRFDFGLLTELTGCDEEELLARMKELIAARLVVEESADRFAFRHALTREAVAGGLLARERRTLHRRILAALLRAEASAPAHDAADLTRHAVAAGAWAEALAYGLRAGERALTLHAPRAAVELFGHALAAAAHLGLPAPPTALRRRGVAHETIGDFDAARRDYEAAVALARDAASGEEEAEALLALGGLWAGRDYQRAEEPLRRALDLARGGGNSALRARALNRLANWLMNREEPVAAFRLHEEALALAEATADRRGIAETLDLLGMARYLAGDFVGSAAALRRVIPMLRELDDRRTLVNALTALAFTMSSLDVVVAVVPAGGYDERLAVAEEAIAVAREIDARSEEALARCAAALTLGERRADEALTQATAALQIAEAIGHRQWTILAHVVRGSVLTALLDRAVAVRHVEAALKLAREANSSFWLREAQTELALALARAGDLDSAEAAIAEALGDETPMETLDQRWAWFARAEVCLMRGEPGLAFSAVDRLIAVAVRDPLADQALVPEMARLRGEALAALGRADEALAALDAARDGAEARDHLTLLWRVQAARAKHLRGLGRREQADRALAAAHAAVAAYAAGIADESLRSAFLQRAAAQLPPFRSPSPRQAAKAVYGGLTSRERAVAVLIAAGRSNREIADALFVSERTAATHVGNILAKLGVKSRAQVAAWAQKHGLADVGAE